jgi:tetratricopeptide (TPR) repeat protein
MYYKPIIKLITIVFCFSISIFAQNPADDMELVHYRLGLRHYKAKEYDKAISAFGKMLTFRPSHAPSHHIMGLCYLEKGDLPQAIASLRKAARFDGENSEVLKVLADAYSKNNEKEKAMSHLRAAIDKEKSADKKKSYENDMALLLGAVHEQQVDMPIIPAKVEAVAAEPVIARDTVLNRLVKLVTDSNFNEAVKEARFLLTKYPGKGGAFYYAALARKGLNQKREALFNFKKALSDPLYAKSAEYYIKQLEADTPVAKKAAITTVPKSTQPVADSVAQKVDTSSAPSVPTISFSFTIAENLNFLIEDTAQKDGQRMLAALDLYLAERADPAINQLRNIYQTSPRSKEADNALYNMGLIYAKLRLWDNAIPFLVKAMKEYSRSDIATPSLALLGHVYGSSGLIDSALAVYDRYLALSPKGSQNLEVLIAKGDLLFNQTKLPAASTIYVSALSQTNSPSVSLELNQKIGECYWKQSEPAKAIEYLKKATTDSVTVSEAASKAIFRLADAFFKIKNFENSLRYYRQAISRFPNSTDVPWALYQMGNIHRRGGQAEAAIKVYDRLITEHSGNYWATQAKWQREDVVWESQYKDIIR